LLFDSEKIHRGEQWSAHRCFSISWVCPLCILLVSVAVVVFFAGYIDRMKPTTESFFTLDFVEEVVVIVVATDAADFVRTRRRSWLPKVSDEVFQILILSTDLIQ